MLTRVAMTREKVDPRVKRTRELILRAFGELLGRKAFEAITVQDIADRATVNRATFYAHFQDKYDLLEHAFIESFQQALYKNLPAGSEYSPHTVQLLIQSVCEFLEELHSHCAPSMRSQFDSVLEKQIRGQLYEVLTSWLVRARPSNLRDEAELRATVAAWAIYGAAAQWSQGDRKEPSEKFARRVLPVILAGLEARVRVV